MKMPSELPCPQGKHPVGISSCLLGEKVRFDGNHKLSRVITEELSAFFDYRPVCPELGSGMGVPRKPIRLEGDPERPRAVGVFDRSIDATDSLQQFSRTIAPSLADLSGYIFKKNSPSCGMTRVKVYNDKGMPQTNGTGIYAREIMNSYPLMPTEEEGRLTNRSLRENFILRVHVYRHWQLLCLEGLTPKTLQAFHSHYKFLIMAHHPMNYRHLGNLVARTNRTNLEEVASQYIAILMATLKVGTDRNKQTNVLYHLMGFFKKALSKQDKSELMDIIQQYQGGQLPLTVPLTMLKHYLRRHPNEYVSRQYYLSLPRLPESN